ncbi:MAG: 30S ribosomal protein S10 [bacterium]
MTKLPRIRIKMVSWDYELLDKSINKIVDIALGTGATISGPVYLPVKRKVFCITRSPHVDKRSGEHFEIRIHKRLVDLVNYTPKTIEEIKKMDIPAGVEVFIKTL